MGLMCLGGRNTLVLTLSPDTPESLSLMIPVKLPFTRSFSSLRPMTYTQDRVIRPIALPRIVEVRYVRSVFRTHVCTVDWGFLLSSIGGPYWDLTKSQNPCF